MQQQTYLEFFIERAPELAQRTAEHLMLTTVSVLVATVLGLAIAVVAFRHKQLKDPITAIVGILQTIPSLALLVMLMTLFGKIGVLPALVALILYALLPIVRNGLIGLESTPDSVIEAAKGIGMTEAQQLILVRFRLAMPAIVAGIRTATVVGVGIATLSAFIGAGGLGEFINRGLALSSTKLILLGAIPSGLLAIIADWTLAAAEWGIQPARKAEQSQSKNYGVLKRRAAASLPIALLLFSIGFYIVEHPALPGDNHIRIGCKHFTEQLILAELMAQTIEGRTKLIVERRFDLGGTLVCHGALIRDEIDTYPEYTGTGMASVLRIEGEKTPARVLAIVTEQYMNKFRIKWLGPFGFNNTWALICAEQKPWRSISDLRQEASSLKIGLPGEFAERADGFPGLKKAYALNFGKVADIDTNIAYKALAEHELDVAAGNATDGRIDAYKLRLLKDDLHFFPPYQAAPIARMDTLAKHPEVEAALNALSGKINDETMRALNYEVDGAGQSPGAVAHRFLKEHPEIIVPLATTVRTKS
jgi:osmoprotectant transport system permease protein